MDSGVCACAPMWRTCMRRVLTWICISEHVSVKLWAFAERGGVCPDSSVWFYFVFWIFAVCLHCVPVLLPSLIFPPHLLCIRLVSTAQFPVFSPANQLLHLIALTWASLPISPPAPNPLLSLVCSFRSSCQFSPFGVVCSFRFSDFVIFN